VLETRRSFPWEYADETFKQFYKQLGHQPSFPLDPELLVREVFGLDVFGLDVYYDSEGILDEIDPSLLACLYPDGTPSP
jgi:hypothetical protein